MPELPEVEAVRRLLERALVGCTLAHVEVADDPIVLEKQPCKAVQAALTGASVAAAGRKGKYWWLELDGGQTLFGHLGMSGWMRDLKAEKEKRLVSHGKAALAEPDGRPRFLKLLLRTTDGAEVAMTDGRRLARLWLGGPWVEDRRIKELGRDAWLDPWPPADLFAVLARRKAPIKALLLDQKLFAGVGNWVADEALFHAGLSPHRLGASLSAEDTVALCSSLKSVLDLAVACEADDARYPEEWMFHHRWGGGRGAQVHPAGEIQRDQVGGRTTAWIPAIQK